MNIEEIGFLFFLVVLLFFFLSTRPHAKEFKTKKSLYSVILQLEKEGKRGAKRIKYLFFAVMISFAAIFLIILI